MSGSVASAQLDQVVMVEVFGGISITIGDRAVSVGGPRQQCLLGALIVELGHTVPVSRLIELVWADGSAPEQAVRTLQSYVSRLRSALGNGAVVRNNDGYSLAVSRQVVSSERFVDLVRHAIGDPSVEPDQRLAMIEQALDLWRGRPFGALGEASFVVPEVQRLQGLRQAALDARVSALIELGRMVEALAAVELLIADSPLRERPYELAMIAYHRVGRSSEALRVFQRCRAQLASESGLDPSSHLAELEALILAGRSLDDQGRSLGSRGADRRRVTGADRNPFKALRPFREEDGGDFFGRDVLVTEALEAVVGCRFVTVVGSSGSGKSSLVRAGVMPALRSGSVKGSSSWLVSTMVPGSRPWEELESALLRVAANPPSTLLEQLRSPDGLVRAVKRVLPNDQAELVLVIDQFEELWTQAADETRLSFLEALADAAGRQRSPLRVIATLRADFVDDVLREPRVAELFRSGSLLLPPLSAEQLERAIRGPLQRVEIDIEPALLARLVAQASMQPGVLPILQYVLWRLYDERDPDTVVLSSADFDRLGGFGGTLAAEAEAIWDRLDVAGRDASRRLFRRLVVPGHERANTRLRAATLGLPDAELRTLDLFVERRLLTADWIDGHPVIELSHEVLLVAWPRLATWIDEDRDLIRQLRRLSEAAAMWEEGGRDPSDLLRGRRLAELTAWRTEAAEGLTDSETAFLAACRAEEHAAVSRQLEGSVRETLSRSVEARSVDTASAINLALDVHELRPGLDTLGAVQGALVAAGSQIGELPAVLDAAWIDDSTFVTIDGHDVCWWHLAELVVVRRVEVLDVRAIDVDLDRQRIAVGSLDGRVLVFDASTGSEVDSIQLPDAVTAIALDRHGSIVVGTETGRILRIGHRHHVEPVHRMANPIAALSCSPVDDSVAASDGTRGSVVVIDGHTSVDEFRLSDDVSMTGTMSLAHAADGTLTMGAVDGLGVLGPDGTLETVPGRLLCQSPRCLDRGGQPTVAFPGLDGLLTYSPADRSTKELCDFDLSGQFKSPALRRSPDGSHVIALAGGWRTFILRTDGGGPINVAVPREEAGMSRIGRAGTLVTTSYRGNMQNPGFGLWDISTDPPVGCVVPSHPYCVFRTGDRPVVWEPVGNTSATWSDDPEQLEPLPFSERFYADIDFTSDFRMAFQASVNGVVEVFDLTNDAAVRYLDLFARPTDDTGLSLDIHPDGDRLLVLCIGIGLAVYRLPSLELDAGPSEAFDAACWSGSGRSIVAVRGDELVVVDGDTLEVIRRAEQSLPGRMEVMGQGEALSITGDRRWIAASTAAGTQLVDPDTLSMVGAPFPHDPSTWCSAVDEVAPRLVTNNGPWVKIWELDPERWLSAARRFVGRSSAR